MWLENWLFDHVINCYCLTLRIYIFISKQFPNIAFKLNLSQTKYNNIKYIFLVISKVDHLLSRLWCTIFISPRLIYFLQSYYGPSTPDFFTVTNNSASVPLLRFIYSTAVVTWPVARSFSFVKATTAEYGGTPTTQKRVTKKHISSWISITRE